LHAITKGEHKFLLRTTNVINVLPGIHLLFSEDHYVSTPASSRLHMCEIF
jgi:hypothetical protein